MPPKAPPGSTPAPGRPRTRWYTHGWNRDLSWRLMDAIIPKVPRPLRPPFHLVTTAVCFLAMPRERAAARRNLGRISGSDAPASCWAAFRLFYNFSKFMVGYTDLLRLSPERLRRLVAGGDEAARRIEALLGEGKGLVILTLHLGQWDMGLAGLAGMGCKVSVVLRPEETDGERLEDEARRRAGVRVVPAGGPAWNGLDLLLSLRRGEVVAIQGDRVLGPPSERLPLFGAPVDLPSGPFALAQASGAPILVVAVPIRGHGRYRILVEGPLRVTPGAAGVRDAALAFGTIVERLVRAYPTQWFNFYEVWPPADAEGGPPG